MHRCQANNYFYRSTYQPTTFGSATTRVLVISRRPTIVADAVLALQIQTKVTREMKEGAAAQGTSGGDSENERRI